MRPVLFALTVFYSLSAFAQDLPREIQPKSMECTGYQDGKGFTATIKSMDRPGINLVNLKILGGSENSFVVGKFLLGFEGSDYVLLKDSSHFFHLYLQGEDVQTLAGDFDNKSIADEYYFHGWLSSRYFSNANVICKTLFR